MAYQLLRSITRIGTVSTVLALAPILHAAAASTGATNPNDYALIVGSDFTVVKDGETHRVVGAGDRTFIADFGKKTRELPLRELKDIQISRGLKLTNLSAKIDGFSVTMSSDAANAEVFEATQTAMALRDAVEIQRDKLLGQGLEAELASAGTPSSESKIFGAATSRANADASMQAALQNMTSNIDSMLSSTRFAEDMMIESGSTVANAGDGIELVPEITATQVVLNITGQSPASPARGADAKSVAGADATEKASRRVRDLGGGRSDRLDLDFEISAPEPLDSAYVVVVTEYTAPTYGTDVFRRVLTQRIGHIDATPRKVHLYQTSFPAGFHLRTYLVNLYANGQEVATNLSETKMRMTRDDAYEYLVVDYLASHKGQTQPPAAVLLAPKAELRQVASIPELRQPLYVSVDDQGKLLSASTTAHRVSPPSPSVAAALEKFRFIPAIENGVPVAGHARLVLADFAD